MEDEREQLGRCAVLLSSPASAEKTSVAAQGLDAAPEIVCHVALALI